jgi:hypothetical protein
MESHTIPTAISLRLTQKGMLKEDQSATWLLRRVVLELPGGAAHRPTDLPRPLAAVSDGETERLRCSFAPR